MKFILLILFSAKASIVGKYTTKAKYIQRGTDQTCDNSLIETPGAFDCEGRDTRDGKMCNITCHDGFEQVNGNGIMTCSCSKVWGPIMLIVPCEWKGEFPTCKEPGVEIISFVDPNATCPDLVQFGYSSFSCTNFKNTDGTVCLSNCHIGYESNLHSSAKEFTCDCEQNDDDTHNCLWTQNFRAANQHPKLISPTTDSSIFAKNIVEPICTEIAVPEGEEYVPPQQCTELSTIGGNFQCSDFLYEKSRCTLKCAVGYVKIGPTNLKSLQCRSGKGDSPAEWSRAIDESCITIGTAITTGDAPTCHDPRGPTEDLVGNYVGDFECNIIVENSPVFLDGALCQLTCPLGYRLKKKENEKTCQCKHGECKWLRDGAVSCVLDKHELKNSGIWKAVKQAGLEGIAQYKKIQALYAASISNVRSLSMSDVYKAMAEKYAIQQIEEQKLISKCPELLIDTSTTDIKCFGNSPGAICTLKCRDSFTFSTGKIKRNNAICGCTRKQCKWSFTASCQ